MVLSDQRTPYSIMYVWAAFEAKSPPTRQDVFTLIDNYTLYTVLMKAVRGQKHPSKAKNGTNELIY